MPIVNMKDMLQHAYQNQYAVGAFDVVNIDFIEGIVNAAEQTQSPVIISLAESHIEYFDFSLLMAAVEVAAKRASIPVAIHLDHGSNFKSAVEAIRLGCNGIMVDASDKPLEKNMSITRELVHMAQSCGISVEGELAYVPGEEGEDFERHPGEIRYTTVDEAKKYVQETGVDFLAVSIGTIHGRMKMEPNLDFQRLHEINSALGIPLVIHGGTGLDNEQFRKLIDNGVAKINYYTTLSDVAAKQIKSNCDRPELTSITSQLKNVSTAIAKEAAKCMRLWGAAGQAESVLEHAQSWLPIEHLIIYNVSGLDEGATKEMALKGRAILEKIPGVRDVFIGQSMRENDNYRYTWLVRFCHPKVINSYREHPDHIAFADNLFRPVAGERISIDYKEIES